MYKINDLSVSYFICSMAKIKTGLGNSDAYMAIDFSGSDEQDQDKEPHVHIIKDHSRLATIRLNPPFKKLGSLTSKVEKDAYSYIKTHLGFIHFSFDVISNSHFYTQEYSGEKNATKRNEYVSDFRSKFPDIEILPIYLN